MTPAFTVRLAWRNLWRQKRRTLLTAGAIAVAMLLSLFMRSMQEGSYAQNLDNATRFYSGYLQLQHPEFSKNRSIDKLLPTDAAFRARVRAIDGLTTAVPRLESFALGAAGDRSKGVVVMGIDPQAEDDYSGISNRIKRGRYFRGSDEHSAIIGGRLAEYLGLELGAQLALYGQGYHGTTAAGLFTVVGILDFPNPKLDGRLVYLPLGTAQQLYGTGEQASAWVLHGTSVLAIPKLERAARKAMAGAARVRNWADIAPELAQQIALDRFSGQFLVFVLYGVVGFGMFATIVMMTLERQREFAVMLATGMVRRRLQLLLTLESLLLALTGVVLGLLITLPVLLWFHAHPIRLAGDLALTMETMGFEPIIPFSLAPQLFITQIGIVLAMLALCATYPLFRVARLQLAPALQG